MQLCGNNGVTDAKLLTCEVIFYKDIGYNIQRIWKGQSYFWTYVMVLGRQFFWSLNPLTLNSQFKKGLLTEGICSHKKLGPCNTEICTFFWGAYFYSDGIKLNYSSMNTYWGLFCFLYLTLQLHFYLIFKSSWSLFYTQVSYISAFQAGLTTLPLWALSAHLLKERALQCFLVWEFLEERLSDYIYDKIITRETELFS